MKNQKTNSPILPSKIPVAEAEGSETMVPATAEASGDLGLMRKLSDATNLQAIEQCIRRDLGMASKLTNAHCLVGVSLGLSLNAAKSLVRHGMFSEWTDRHFGDTLKPRTMQTYMKLAKAFVKHAEQLKLPKPRETGLWLMQQSRNSGELYTAVDTFVGERTISELYDDYGIKAKKDKGGYRANDYLLQVYLGEAEHAHLEDIPFENWSGDDQAAFRLWADREQAANGQTLNAEASESLWSGLVARLGDQMRRKSYAFLSKAAREDLIARLEGFLDELRTKHQ